MFKLPHNFIYFTCQQGHAQNPPSQPSTVCNPRTWRCTSWIKKRQRIQKSNANIIWVTEKGREFQEKKKSSSTLLTSLKLLIVWITTNWKILQEMGISDNLTCLLRSLFVGKEARVRTKYGTPDCFKRSVPRLYIVSLFI